MLKALYLFPCKSAKIYPAKVDPCESIYLKWKEYDAKKGVERGKGSKPKNTGNKKGTPR
jgi:hypothetical protein